MKNIKNYENYLNERFTKTGPASDSELIPNYDIEIEDEIEIDDDEDIIEDDELDMVNNNLEELEIGNNVIHTGDSSFCDTSEEIIDNITIKYDENTGKPYKVIHIKSGQKFDARNGAPLTPPWAYYITTK